MLFVVGIWGFRFEIAGQIGFDCPVFGEKRHGNPLRLNPDYSRGVGVESENTNFIGARTTCLRFWQFTDCVNFSNRNIICITFESFKMVNATPVVVNNSG